jgi:hypothetical protein
MGWNTDHNSCASGGNGVNLDPSPDGTGALAHYCKSKSGKPASSGRGRIEAGTVILYHYIKTPWCPAELHTDTGGTGVLPDVRERFLHDAH